MPLVTQAEIEAARQVDLLTYLRQTDPDEVVPLGRNNYCTREHDSLKISNGKWYWFSQGVGGVSALDYLIKVKHLSLPEAVESITGRSSWRPSFLYVPKPPKKKAFALPDRNETPDAVARYLLGRGIHREILDACLEDGSLYESSPYHNAVFVGFDSAGQPRYGALRGTVGSFKGEVAGSEKRFAFRLPGNPQSGSVHLFESAIDAMSYATLLRRAGRRWQAVPLLSLSGVSKYTGDHVIPAALQQYLEDHPRTGTLILHLDNDEVGRGAARNIAQKLGDRVQVLDRPPPEGKDVNDYLMQHASRQRRKEVQER